MIPNDWEQEFEKLEEVKIDFIELFSEKKMIFHLYGLKIREIN